MKNPKKLTPPEKDNRNELYFEISESCIRDYHDGKEWGEWATDYVHSLDKVSRNKDLLNKWNFESHKVPDEVYNATSVYVVVVTYDSGDTFGRSTGHLAIAFVTENADEAVACKNAILEQEEYKNEHAYSFRKKTGKLPTWDNMFRKHPKSVREGYAPWNGYFEHITSVDIKFIQIMG